MSASQSGTWLQELTDGTNVLGTPSHPLRTDPTGTTTQPVSGNVGITDGTNVLGTPSHPLRTDPTGTTTQPVSGTVGLSPGSSDIGTVHVAAPSLSVNYANCQATDGERSCDTSDLGLSAGTIIDTISANCTVAAGQKPAVAYVSVFFEINIPLNFQQSYNGIDSYYATLTDLNYPVQSNGESFFSVAGDYQGSNGNGASCYLTYVSTSAS